MIRPATRWIICLLKRTEKIKNVLPLGARKEIKTMALSKCHSLRNGDLQSCLIIGALEA